MSLYLFTRKIMNYTFRTKADGITLHTHIVRTHTHTYVHAYKCLVFSSYRPFTEPGLVCVTRWQKRHCVTVGARSEEAWQLLLWSLGILTLVKMSSHVKSLNTLRMLCWDCPSERHGEATWKRVPAISVSQPRPQICD